MTRPATTMTHCGIGRWRPLDPQENQCALGCQGGIWNYAPDVCDCWGDCARRKRFRARQYAAIDLPRGAADRPPEACGPDRSPDRERDRLLGLAGWTST